jgi:crossover junction endodeoxyribonuclease RuvC
MKILGIDPGLATIGLGLIEAENSHSMTPLDWLTITTPANTPLLDRLEEISKDLSAYLEETKPDLAVVEKIFFAVNERTVIDVAQARGVILQTLASHKIPVIEPTPLQLKSAITGDGRADKRQIQDMLVILLKLDEIPHPDDAADALALAVFGTLENHTLKV